MKRKAWVMNAAARVIAVTLPVLALTGAVPAQSAATRALFDLNATSTSPFPSNWFTVPDNTNKTHLRVNLPYPNCETYASDCQDVTVLNELDGFNLLPRLSIPFSGPIDPDTVNSGSVFLVSLGRAGFGQDYMPWGTVIGINQVVWDPDANILHVESDQLLAQHTRFALIVTRKVHDAHGSRVAASEAFRHFRDTVREDYRLALVEAIQAARHAGIHENDIAVASVFTTQSATAIMEKIRDQIHDPNAPPDPASFALGPDGYRTVFSLDQVTGITWNQQKTIGSSLTPMPLSGLASIQNGNVGTIAFGKYSSPDYLVHPYQYIPVVGTRSGTPAVQGWSDIYFNLYLPSGDKPLNGWPVAIYVHQINGSKEVSPLDLVNSMASHGIATIVINDVAHGFGPLSTLSISLKDASPVEFPAGGRGIDQNGDTKIGSSEGIQAVDGTEAIDQRRIVIFSDTFRQTAADLMQLVREIEVGMDVDGDLQPDLDPARIYLWSHSLGGGIGTIFFAVEPDVRIGVLDVPFDPIPASILSCKWRYSVGALLGSRTPPLINSSKIMALDGCPLAYPAASLSFNENFPLRDGLALTVGLQSGTATVPGVIQSPVTNDVDGAMAIQEAAENYKWVSQAGSPLAYAPHLSKAPLAGVPPKSVLFLMAKGDQTATNPSDTAIVRAGDLADSTLYYRHDLYYAKNLKSQPTLDKNPHSFALQFGEISQAVQEMIGKFFESDGAALIAPGKNLSRFFEFPIRIEDLPENLNYSSIQ